jgi:hypothetical protein
LSLNIACSGDGEIVPVIRRRVKSQIITKLNRPHSWLGGHWKKLYPMSNSHFPS